MPSMVSDNSPPARPATPTGAAAAPRRPPQPGEADPHPGDSYRALLATAVDRPPPQQQKVWHLAREQNLSYGRIAGELRIAPSTVKSHMQAALHSIRDYVRGHIDPAHERRLELFCEWGHRWLDLKRTGQAETALGGITYKHSLSSDALLYPIPYTELTTDPNLVQNNGY
jgi:hypothetical protein